MRVHAVVPVKALARGKSRLAGALAEAHRTRLIRTMLEHVVAAAAAVPGLAEVSVLTQDPALVPPGVGYLADPGDELNGALACTWRTLREAGSDVMLVVGADLPFVTSEDIGAIAAASRDGGVVAAPDWKGVGTNALAVPLARELPTRFGPGSLAAHEAAARGALLPWTLVQRPGLAFDLDEPAQLAPLVRAGGERYAFLAEPCGIIPSE